ncbi:TetR/AcrR family transcriptional regulator [Paenibacillus mesophilus]|uniref:TetR/AcrR family transcriptional regulator n=1 Tax=Paenibacillus mesophilus TaxID=2582849 RepID=UPI00110F1D29|nr:TetR/AcrR family transcriptional regulator [Paenibacillus mesophilus]TMV50073.1 TetR/AcrR family transcriptional regulator [Paenibacillus mesophilus]
MSYDKIKQAAMKHFARSGYEGASLADIASEVGIKKPSLYNHFAGKEQLFLSVLGDISEDYKRFLLSKLTQMEHLSPERQLFGMYRAYIEYFTFDSVRTDFWKRVMLFPPASLTDKIVQLVGEVEQLIAPRLAALFRDGISRSTIRENDPNELVTFFYSLVNGYMMGLMMTGPHDFTNKLDRIWTMFWQGIGSGRWETEGNRDG